MPLSSFSPNCASVARPWAELQLSLAWGNGLVIGLIRGLSVRLARSTILIKRNIQNSNLSTRLIFQHVEASVLAVFVRAHAWLNSVQPPQIREYIGNHKPPQQMQIYRLGGDMMHTYCHTAFNLVIMKFSIVSAGDYSTVILVKRWLTWKHRVTNSNNKCLFCSNLTASGLQGHMLRQHGGGLRLPLPSARLCWLWGK